MQKRLLCAALALMMLVCGLSLTALAEEAQVLHTVSSLRFPAAYTIIGEEATLTYQYENEDIQNNNEISRAEYIPIDRTILVGDVGFDNQDTGAYDSCDIFKITLDQSCHLSFFGISGNDGLNTTSFDLLDSNGELLYTADYSGETNTDDYYELEVALGEGTYYIRVTDPENWAQYYFTFILSPALDAPVFSGITVEPDTGKPVLTWNAAEGASGYEIYRGESGDGSFEQLTVVEGTTFTDTTAGAGVVYDYKLIAVSGDASKRNSPYSGEISVVCALAKPVAGIANDADTGKPVVSWEAVEGAEGYEICRSFTEEGDYEPAGLVTDGTDFLDLTAQVGTEYFYKVRAVHSNAQANSVLSEAVSIVCKLGKPVVTTENNDAGKPVVKWETVDGAQKYRIYRSTSATKGFELVETAVAARKYTDKNASTGKVYYYKVRAIYEDFTADSEVVSRRAILAKPTVTISGASATGKNVVKWNTVSGASKYYVYRAAAEDGEYEQVYTAVSARSYTDEDTSAGIAYYYRVKAVYKNTAANSEDSYVVSRVCALEKPAVEITNSDSGKPVVSWELQEAAAAYEICRAASKSGSYEWVYTAVGEDSYTDEAAELGKTYYYKVKAVHTVSEANSADSNTVSIICTLPRAVVRITGDSDTGKNIVEWETVEGAKTYRVYRSTSEKSGYSLIYSSSTVRSYTDKSVSAGTKYYYKVRAVCEDYSSDSRVVSRVCALAKPVVSISRDSTSGNPVVKWKTVSGAAKYYIYRADAEDGEYEQVETAVSARSYTDETAEAGSTYYYRVQAIHKKDNADSDYSEAVSCMCALAKPAVTAAKSGSGKPVVSWELQEGAAGYRIFRSTSKSSGYEPVYTAVDEDSYTDEAAVIGKTYYYKVKALHETEGADSVYSAVVSCVCGLPSPEVDIDINSDTGKPIVGWETVEGAAKYYVYRSTSESSGYEKVYTGITARSYTDKNAKAGTTYYYKVKAIHENSSASSEYSRVVSRICAPAKPEVSVSVNASTGKPVVKWQTVTGANKYQVYRALSGDGEYELVYTAVSARSYTDNKAEAGSTYYYRVVAVHEKSGTDSGYSETLSQICALEKPMVSITRKSGKPSLSWEEISGAAEYQVYRATSKTGKYTLVGTVTEGSFTDTAAKSGKTYYYKVMAIHENPDANSGFSTVKYITSK